MPKILIFMFTLHYYSMVKAKNTKNQLSRTSPTPAPPQVWGGATNVFNVKTLPRLGEGSATLSRAEGEPG